MSFRDSRSSFALFFLGLLSFLADTHSARGDDVYSDDRYQFKVTVPEPWKKAPLANYGVPGTARGAWAGKNNDSIVAFIQEPGKPFSPRFLLDQSAAAIEKSLGAKVFEKKVETVAGMKSMWLAYEGKGNGGFVDGKGDILTTQHWVAIPRETDILVLLLTCPTKDYIADKTTFESAIKSLEIKGAQTKEQSAAK